MSVASLWRKFGFGRRDVDGPVTRHLVQLAGGKLERGDLRHVDMPGREDHAEVTWQ